MYYILADYNKLLLVHPAQSFKWLGVILQALLEDEVGLLGVT